MKELDKRTLNLLVHLAKVDGKYEKSERKLLRQFVKEKGLNRRLLDGDASWRLHDDQVAEIDARIELLYWAIKLIQADQVIHENEIAFGRALEGKLNFKEGIIAHYAEKPVIDYKVFQSEVKQFWI